VTDQFKKLAFLVAKPGLSDAAFREYWVTTHGPCVAGSPGYGQWRLRYVQNHVVGRGPVGEAFDFAGMAEFWLPGNSPNEDTFSTTPIYRDRIAVDERNFIDMERTVSMAAVEDVIREGRGPCKLVILSRRASGVTADDLRRRYATEYARAALASPGFGDRVRAWTVNRVVEGSYRLPGARPAVALAVDAVEELWFESEAEVNAAFNSAEYARRAAPIAGALFASEGRRSFVAREHVFFDRGRPVEPPPRG
jgi:uncharacterized protein (TIGR02118 family)